MKLHQKAYLLDQIARNPGIWDYELINRTFAAYGLSGDYWIGGLRLALTELSTGGLIESQ